MTLTELRYIVAVARERHFGRAAESCFVSQPTLSVAVRKLEDELGVQIFERGQGELTLTRVGRPIVEQAQRVLEEAEVLRSIAQQDGRSQSGALRLGVIYTIGPYILPQLVPAMMRNAPQVPLLLNENFTLTLIEQLRVGELDVAILADPFPSSGLFSQAVYDEPFVVAVPRAHAWAGRERIGSAELKDETMLLLGNGHCFRDQVVEVCPELSRPLRGVGGLQRTFVGSSLETIRHMVASGIGITVLPASAVGGAGDAGTVSFIPFEEPGPSRRVVLAWRKSFPRGAAIEQLRQALLALDLRGIAPLPDAPVVGH